MSISGKIREQTSPDSIGQMLDEIDAFLSKFLICSTQQRTILALWIGHTFLNSPPNARLSHN
jgi:hypothetical protein